jgi:hypothetical protein
VTTSPRKYADRRAHTRKGDETSTDSHEVAGYPILPVLPLEWPFPAATLLLELLLTEEREPEAGRPTPAARLSPTLRLCGNEQWVDSDAGYDIAHMINP